MAARVFELTTVFRATSAAKTKSQAQAANSARAHIRYITRPEAKPVVITSQHSRTITAKEGRELISKAANDRAKQRKNGRVLERVVISLPKELDIREQAIVTKRIVDDISFNGKLVAVATIHRDRPENPHLHLTIVDAKESREEAQARRPGAQRVRQQDRLRLGELGAPELWRDRIGRVMNQTIKRLGKADLVHVETRSFTERGIETEATAHKGPDYPQMGDTDALPVGREADDAEPTALDAAPGPPEARDAPAPPQTIDPPAEQSQTPQNTPQEAQERRKAAREGDTPPEPVPEPVRPVSDRLRAARQEAAEAQDRRLRQDHLVAGMRRIAAGSDVPDLEAAHGQIGGEAYCQAKDQVAAAVAAYDQMRKFPGFLRFFERRRRKTRLRQAEIKLSILRVSQANDVRSLIERKTAEMLDVRADLPAAEKTLAAAEAAHRHALEQLRAIEAEKARLDAEAAWNKALRNRQRDLRPTELQELPRRPLPGQQLPAIPRRRGPERE